MIDSLAGPPIMPPGVKNKCNAQIDVIWPELQAAEDTYYTAHGVYWQGLITHQGAIPENGADVLPNVGTLTPTDQPDPWPAALIAQPMAMALVVDMYDGPLGDGYVMTATVQITPVQVPEEAAMRWARSLAVGPEPGWDHDWAAVPEGAI